MVKAPKILSTKNYAQFKSHTLNRDTQLGGKPKNKKLLKSMMKFGFDPLMSTITVWKDPEDGLYEIGFGHNRFDCAKYLDLPVYYVVSNEKLDPRDDDGSSSKSWSGGDHVTAFARDGKEDYILLKDLSSEHKLAVNGVLAGILSGNFIASKSVDLASGGFKVTSAGGRCWDRILPVLLTITDGDSDLRKAGFMVRTRAISVLAAIASVDNYDPERMANQIRKNPAQVQEQTSRQGYLQMLETLYNKGFTLKAKYNFAGDVKQKVDEIAGRSVTQWWNG